LREGGPGRAASAARSAAGYRRQGGYTLNLGTIKKYRAYICICICLILKVKILTYNHVTGNVPADDSVLMDLDEPVSSPPARGDEHTAADERLLDDTSESGSGTDTEEGDGSDADEPRNLRRLREEECRRDAEDEAERDRVSIERRRRRAAEQKKRKEDSELTR